MPQTERLDGDMGAVESCQDSKAVFAPAVTDGIGDNGRRTPSMQTRAAIFDQRALTS